MVSLSVLCGQSLLSSISALWSWIGSLLGSSLMCTGTTLLTSRKSCQNAKDTSRRDWKVICQRTSQLKLTGVCKMKPMLSLIWIWLLITWFYWSTTTRSWPLAFWWSLGTTQSSEIILSAFLTPTSVLTPSMSWLVSSRPLKFQSNSSRHSL